MESSKCPECGNDVSNQVKTCPYCGYEISKEDEQIKEKYNNLIHKNKKYIIALLCIVGCLFLIAAITRITNDEYKFYKQHYQECIDGYNDTKWTADSFSGGFFKSSYDSIASSYKDLADNDKKELWKFRIQAILLVCGGCGLILFGYTIYKKER